MVVVKINFADRHAEIVSVVEKRKRTTHATTTCAACPNPILPGQWRLHREISCGTDAHGNHVWRIVSYHAEHAEVL